MWAIAFSAFAMVLLLSQYINTVAFIQHLCNFCKIRMQFKVFIYIKYLYKKNLYLQMFNSLLALGLCNDL